MSKNNVPPDLSAIQDDFDFGGPRRPRYNVVVAVQSGQFSLSGSYEGDLAVTGAVAGISFFKKPVNLAYIDILNAFLECLRVAVASDDVVAVANAVKMNCRNYVAHGREVHKLAIPACADGGRMTTAITFLNNYIYTVLMIGRKVLGDTSDLEARVQIDRNYAGLKEWDGMNVDWAEGYKAHSSITKVQRTDLSKGMGYSSGRNNAQRRDSRMDMVLKMLRDPETIVKGGSPNQIVHPIADALRATPNSTALLIIQTVNRIASLVRTQEVEEEEV